MRKSLLTTIAAAALIAGAGLAKAQQTPGRNRPDDAQGYSERQPGAATNSSERQPGAMENQGRSAATEQKEHRSGQPGAMENQGRSAGTEQKGHRSSQSGEMQGQAHKRSGAVEEKERRSGHPSAMQGQAQGRPSGIEEKEHRSGQSGAMQSPAQERSGRSVGSTTLSSDQKTRLHGIITGGNIQRANHVDFPLTVGTHVPDTVTLYDVPETIVDILPQYRDFEYIVVGDELVIIDPDTLDIVAVLPA
jgi:hypothetical protein